MKKVFIIGLGVSGQAAARSLLEEGMVVYGYDQRGKNDPKIAALLQEGLIFYDQGLPKGCSFVVLSPGIANTHPFILEAKEKGIPWYGEAEMALQRKGKRRILGVTGTNGKTTTVCLAQHLLQSCGVLSVALGNIGPPFSSMLQKSEESLVVGEFSSYQLETLLGTPLERAVIINITADHLDRYKSFDDYRRAKLSIIDRVYPLGAVYMPTLLLPFIKEDRVCIETEKVWQEVKGQLFYKGKKVCRMPEGLKGFSKENFLAAVWLCLPYVKDWEGLGNIASFVKPEHRMQQWGFFGKKAVIDDGKATNIASVIAAIQSLEGPIDLLLGGRHKGERYHSLIPVLLGKVRHIYCFGEARGEIAQDLKKVVNLTCYESLQQAVFALHQKKQESGTILFSPGCSSFDAYANYIERSLHFRKLLQNSGL